MDKIASLQKRAKDVARQIFARLPLSRRVAHVMLVLAGVDLLLKALGRPLGAVFLLKGVTGLPDINGKPALEWFAEQSNKTVDGLTRRLPTNYLDQAAVKMRNSMGSKFGPDIMQDAIGTFLLKFISQKSYEHMHDGISLGEAIGYVATSIKNAAIAIQRSNKHENRNRSLDDTDDEGKATFNPADPRSLKDFATVDNGKPIWHMPQVKRILETKAHPDAPAFLDLLLEGHNQKEIVGDFRHKEVVVPSMLPHLKNNPISFSAWEYRTMPKIKDILQTALVDEDEDNASWAKRVEDKELYPAGVPKKFKGRPSDYLP